MHSNEYVCICVCNLRTYNKRQTSSFPFRSHHDLLCVPPFIMVPYQDLFINLWNSHWATELQVAERDTTSKLCALVIESWIYISEIRYFGFGKAVQGWFWFDFFCPFLVIITSVPLLPSITFECVLNLQFCLLGNNQIMRKVYIANILPKSCHVRGCV